MMSEPHVSVAFTIDSINILLKKGPIQLSLHLSQPDIDPDLLFCLTTREIGNANTAREKRTRTRQQILLHVVLHPQQKQPQNLMRCLDSLLTLLLFLLWLLILMQKTVQIRKIDEYLREFGIQRGEQLLQAILQRGSHDLQASTGDKGADDLRKNGIVVLGTVRFVNDDVLETEFLEGRFFDEADLIARYAYFEILWYESVRDDLRALFLSPGEDDDVHVWSP